MPPKSLIIVPTYNEKENLPLLIEAIFKEDLNIDILVVDDNSPDGTGRLADHLAAKDGRVHVVHRQKKSGLGKAYVEGFKYALQHPEYAYVFEMDADFSHDPKYLPQFFEAIKSHDLVIGSRYISGVNVINWPMSRLLLSYLANRYVRLVTGMPIRDATAGFKCFRRNVIQQLNLVNISASGYFFQIEVNFLCWRKGLRIREIPIVFVDRQRGSSKMSTGIVREALFLMWKLRLAALFKRYS